MRRSRRWRTCTDRRGPDRRPPASPDQVALTSLPSPVTVASTVSPSRIRTRQAAGSERRAAIDVSRASRRWREDAEPGIDRPDRRRAAVARAQVGERHPAGDRRIVEPVDVRRTSLPTSGWSDRRARRAGGSRWERGAWPRIASGTVRAASRRGWPPAGPTVGLAGDDEGGRVGAGVGVTGSHVIVVVRPGFVTSER